VEIKNAIEVNQEQIKSYLGELVRQSVEETLNGLLDERLTGCAKPSGRAVVKRRAAC